MSKLNKWQGKTELEVSVSDYVLRNLTTGVETFIDTVKSETLSKNLSSAPSKTVIILYPPAGSIFLQR